MENYNDLLTKPYASCCQYLLEKYGPATDDYFSEKSYQRFKNGEIKSLAKKKISRTGEGLYIHHMDEDKQIMIQNLDAIKRDDIPFEYQKKERLVYCNLIEHAILHILIAKEEYESGKFNPNISSHGIGGFLVLIRPQIYQWLILEVVPTIPWQINCRNAISMSKSDAKKLLSELDSFLINHYPISQSQIDTATKKWLEKMGSL